MPQASSEDYPQLLSLAVHEFRTPASVVGGYLRMLHKDLDDPLTDRQRKMIEESEKSCARLVAMIAQLSDISKLDGGQITLAQQPLDLFGIVGTVAEQMHEAQDRGVRLSVRGPDSGAVLNGDAPRLNSALEAILRAILREKAGPCTVVAERSIVADGGRRSAVVAIADEADVQSVVTSAAGPFDEKRGGLGLSLPLAARVIAGHGGRLWSPASNDASDMRARGSAVVTLPLTESQR